MLRIAFGLVVGMLSAAPAFAQAAAPANNPFVFPGDGGVILNFVKADKTADFETVLGKVKEGLAKSEKEEREQQATGWQVLKATEPAANASVSYVVVMDPVDRVADVCVG